jgi:hypothetical protein
MLLTPGTRLGPYEIESLIGSAGMGEVYKAHDGRLNRTVAIKRLIADDASQFQERGARHCRDQPSTHLPDLRRRTRLPRPRISAGGIAWSADALLRSGRFRAGRDQLLDALTTYESAASGAPANVVIAISRSMVENKLGQVSLVLGDRATALRYCERAERRMESLRSDNPEVFDIDYALAESYSCIGDSHAGPAATPWYEKSIAAWHRAPNPGPYSNSGFSLGSIVDVEGKLAALKRVN